MSYDKKIDWDYYAEKAFKKFGKNGSSHLESIDFYKKFKPINHSQEEWNDLVYKIFEKFKFCKENNAPFSEKAMVLKLYKFYYE